MLVIRQPSNTQASLKSINKSNSFIYYLYMMVLFAFYFALRIGYSSIQSLHSTDQFRSVCIYFPDTHRDIINISGLHNRLNSFNNLITHRAPANRHLYTVDYVVVG